MERFTLLTTVAFFAATAAWGYLHLEDFQSFDDGQDIDDSPDWTWYDEMPPNEYRIRCFDMGGGFKVGAFYPENPWSYCMYVWEAADPILDCGIAADVTHTEDADEPKFDLHIRWYSELGWFDSYFLRIELADTYTRLSINDVLWETQLDPMQHEEWNNFSFYVQGTDPVIFDVYVDGEKVGSHTEYDYLFWGTKKGIGGTGVYDIDELYVDNVVQLECPEDMGISPVSFGAVKALFR